MMLILSELYINIYKHSNNEIGNDEFIAFFAKLQKNKIIKNMQKYVKNNSKSWYSPIYLLYLYYKEEGYHEKDI